jgi:hypothetical protein
VYTAKRQAFERTFASLYSDNPRHPYPYHGMAVPLTPIAGYALVEPLQLDQRHVC